MGFENGILRCAGQVRRSGISYSGKKEEYFLFSPSPLCSSGINVEKNIKIAISFSSRRNKAGLFILGYIHAMQGRRNTLKIEALRRTFLFAIEHVLLRFLEILSSDPHSSLSERHQPSLGANGLEIENK